MATSSLTPGGLKRYSRWLAVQKAKGRVPSATDVSSFLQGEIEANISTDVQNQSLSLGREQLALNKDKFGFDKEYSTRRLDLLEDEQDAEKRADTIRGVSEIAKLGLAVNEGTDGALWQGAKDVATAGYNFLGEAFGSPAPEAFSEFSGALDTSAISQATIPAWEPTVLCTELYHQKILPYEIYVKDAQFGATLSFEVLDGYLLWAEPLAKLMSKSKLFTNIIKYPVLKWANHMAGNKNWFGSIALKIGIPLCRIIGRYNGYFNRYRTV